MSFSFKSKKIILCEFCFFLKIFWRIKVVNNLESLEELNTTDFIDKTRENETRFESLADMKIYHALLIKNEFINNRSENNSC